MPSSLAWRDVFEDERQLLIARSSHPVRPLADRNQKQGQLSRSVLNSHSREARQACAPSCKVCEWKEKHQVGVPVPVTIAEVPLF